jgi:hypothetical protein
VQPSPRSTSTPGSTKTRLGRNPSASKTRYVTALAKADVFVGVYGTGYGKYTIEEFEEARKRGSPACSTKRRSPRTRVTGNSKSSSSRCETFERDLLATISMTCRTS